MNYSTLELGLGLGVSIKTIKLPGRRQPRYTKNYTRVDGELRAEASDYHERQPYSVLAALFFLPATPHSTPFKISSFGASVAGIPPTSRPRRAEGLPHVVRAGFHCVVRHRCHGLWPGRLLRRDEAPPRSGKPKVMLTLDQVCDAITETYDARNSPEFVWADGTPAPHSPPDVEPEDEVA